jgi:hypothetical protein
VGENGHDLYRIDDLLLRAGGACLLLLLAAAAGVVVAGLAAGSPDGRDPGLAALVRHGFPLAVAALCPVALLAAGLTVRRRERRIVAIWRLLRQNAEISVPGLLANSDFERRDLDGAVRFLNNRGLGHYVWDRDSDTIQDARLRSSHLHVEKCDACGATIALDLPVACREIPRCPHCHEPAVPESLQELRRESIEALRAEHRPRPGARGADCAAKAAFSPAIFVLLLFVCWPAAVVYSWFKWQGRL